MGGLVPSVESLANSRLRSLRRRDCALTVYDLSCSISSPPVSLPCSFQNTQPNNYLKQPLKINLSLPVCQRVNAAQGVAHLATRLQEHTSHTPCGQMELLGSMLESRIGGGDGWGTQSWGRGAGGCLGKTRNLMAPDESGRETTTPGSQSNMKDGDDDSKEKP